MNTRTNKEEGKKETKRLSLLECSFLIVSNGLESSLIHNTKLPHLIQIIP